MIRKTNVINLLAVLVSICVLMSLTMSVCTGFDVDTQSEFQNYKIAKRNPNFLSPQVLNSDVADNVRAQLQEDVVYWDWVQLTTDGYNRHPRIHNNMIVWQNYEDSENPQIFLYDGSDIVQLSDNGYHARFPKIHNGMVTWEGYDGNDWEIYLYDGFTVNNISANAFDDNSPQIHDGMVTWSGYDGNDWEIFLYDGFTVNNISANLDYYDFYPQLHNGMVTWIGQLGDSEIFLYDGIEVAQLTDNHVSDFQPSIHNGKVVWARKNDDPFSDPYSAIISYSESGEELVVESTEYYVEYSSPKIHNGIIVFECYEIDPWSYLSYYTVGVYTGDSPSFLNAGEAYEKYLQILPRVHDGIIAWKAIGMDLHERIFITDYLGNSFPKSEIFRGYVVPSLDLHNGNVTWSYEGDIFFLGYDNRPPILSDPDDLTFLEGSAGETIQWETMENNPAYIMITQDEKVILEDNFPDPNPTIILELDYLDLQPGSYTFECTVFDKLGYSSSDTVEVDIVSVAPIWEYEPQDKILYVGDSFLYQLVAADNLGHSLFGISEWWINDTTHFYLTAVSSEFSSTAYITNKVPLMLGDYGIEVVVTDLEGYTLTGSFTVHVISLPYSQLELKLSGNFDYLEKEEIHLQIAGLLTDSITGAVISGATVTFEIYNPDGILIISGVLVETTSGVYVYKADDTIKNLKDILIKGIYWVFARAITEDGREAVDMIQFHIDPPGGSSLSFFTPLSFLGIFSLGCVAIFYVKKWRLS